MIADVLNGVALAVRLAVDNIPPGDPSVKVARVKARLRRALAEGRTKDAARLQVRLAVLIARVQSRDEQGVDPGGADPR